MPRSKKATVDYFPHSCLHGRTLHIIESKFANDGYAFWFKLLESLGSTENHFIDCNDPATWEYLLAQTRVSGETAESILGLLASLGAIRSEFWKMRIVWSENFVKNLEAVYQRRRIDVFTVNDIEAYCKQKYSLSGINVNINPQSKVKESKVEERKVDKRPRKLFSKPSLDEVKAYIQEKGYTVNADAFMARYESNGWMVGRNAMKDWKATVRYWQSNGFGNNNGKSNGKGIPAQLIIDPKWDREHYYDNYLTVSSDGRAKIEEMVALYEANDNKLGSKDRATLKEWKRDLEESK